MIATAPRHGFAWMIGLYQRHVSPHKGFCCAHRVLHQGESCSQYAKRVLLSQGVRQALVKTLERFQACKTAYQALMARRTQRRSKSDYVEPALQALDCMGKLDCGVLETASVADCAILDCAGACAI